jgi:nucleoside-diphosphate-sugar epimerase
MNVLLTGAAGYLGSVLTPTLHEAGHRVVALDRSGFGNGLPNDISVLTADVLDFQVDWLNGIDAIIHLAACSSDKSADGNPGEAWHNNVIGAERLIQACLEAGVSRFVFASTCSVYGFRPEEILDETATPRPVGRYSESKYAVEVALNKARSATFHPFILRKPTLHGSSPRMRTDMVVHSMLKSALLEGIICVHNPEVWRPVLHVRDAAFAYLRALEAPAQFADVYNVHFANYRLMDIALVVQDALAARGHATEIKVEHSDMPMSYRVKSEKIHQCLQVRPSRSIESSVHEMLDQSCTGFDWSSRN